MSSTKGPVDAVRFGRGLTFAQYMDIIEVNEDEFRAQYQSVCISTEDAEVFAEEARRRGGLKVVALAEDWCGDVVRNLPTMARIAEAAPGIELRIFQRDQNLDIMDQYLKQGQFRSIPTFVFFDSAFNEIGRWQERPAAASQFLEELKAEQARTNAPDEVSRLERRRQMAEAYKERLTQETVRELRQVLAP